MMNYDSIHLLPILIHEDLNIQIKNTNVSVYYKTFFTLWINTQGQFLFSIKYIKTKVPNN